MAVSYKELYHLLVDRDMTAVQLQQQAGYSANITTRLKKNAYKKVVSLNVQSAYEICATRAILSMERRIRKKTGMGKG